MCKAVYDTRSILTLFTDLSVNTAISVNRTDLSLHAFSYNEAMQNDAFQQILMSASRERSERTVLRTIVDGLAEQPHTALARVWLIGPGDICANCGMRRECPDQSRCLHLAASSGRSLAEPGADWTRIDGDFRRFPVGVRKVGQIAATGMPLFVTNTGEQSEWIARPEGYVKFLNELLRQRNAGRQSRLREEQAVLRPLPVRRYESWRSVQARVGVGSTLKVDRNTYSVPSRLIGEMVEVRIGVEELEVWFGGVLTERLPRLRGRGQERINYRHVIEWLVRKPGAFERYRYREDLFPTSRFRMAYDALQEQLPERAVREYLTILELSALDGEERVDDALRVLLGRNGKLTAKEVEQFVKAQEAVPEVTAVTVAEVNLSWFDQLLEDREVWSGNSHGSEDDITGAVENVAIAGVP